MSGHSRGLCKFNPNAATIRSICDIVIPCDKELANHSVENLHYDEAGNCEETQARPHLRLVSINFNAFVHCSSELSCIFMEYEAPEPPVSSIFPLDILNELQFHVK